MRKYFNFTIAQISSCLDNLESGRPDYDECLSELKHRNSKKAKILLEKYERVVTTIKAIETAPTLARNGKAGDTELSKRLSCLIESIEKIVNQQSIQFSTLSTSDFQERHIFGLNSLEIKKRTSTPSSERPRRRKHAFKLKRKYQFATFQAAHHLKERHPMRFGRNNVEKKNLSNNG